MPHARVVFVVAAPGEAAGRPLERTLKSLADLDWPAAGAAIVVDRAGLPAAECLLENLEGPVPDAPDPSPFNKRPLGLPAFCVAFGDDAEPADMANAAVEEAGPAADIVVPLHAGDTVGPDYCRLVVPHFEEDLGVVGAVYTDRYEVRAGGTLRVYEEPYGRERLMSRLWDPPAAAFARFAIESAGGFAPLGDATNYDLWLKITKTRVAVHVPAPLATVPSRELSDERRRAAWRTAVELAGRREA